MEFNNHNLIYKKIAQLIRSTFREYLDSTNLDIDEASLSESKIYRLLTPPPKTDMGDVAFACFSFAKELKLSPAKIAAELSEVFKSEGILSNTKSFGPYLNFYLNSDLINNIILDDILDGSFFKTNMIKRSPKTMIEYSQPNTHKEMHVGHMRNLCLGNSIVKLYKYAGIETLSTTFPGDVGTHVAKCLWFYKKYNKETPPETRKGAWLGPLYTKANNLLESEKGSPKEEKNRKELTSILKQLHAKKGEYFDLWKETRAWSLELMQGVYNWANVTFDSWYWESDVDSSSVELALKYYEKGLFIRDKGAIGIDLSDDKLGFCLLLKTDGTGLYATKDIELARRKFEDEHIEKNIYIVDNRQALHFKQVFRTLEKMGFENAKNCHHLQYEMVELSNGPMSSRKGNIIPIQTLIDEMVHQVRVHHLEKYKDTWSSQEINNVANIVAAGAIKYGMTRVDSNKKIIFNMDEWLKLDGESGPYIQYVHARIHSLVSKVGSQENKVNFKLLTHPLEKNLILKLSQLNLVVEHCVLQSKTHPLCSYLYELSKSFNSFYAECSVVNATSEDLKFTRVRLCEASALVIKNGLELLGIDAPKKM